MGILGITGRNISYVRAYRMFSCIKSIWYVFGHTAIQASWHSRSLVVLDGLGNHAALSRVFTYFDVQ